MGLSSLLEFKRSVRVGCHRSGNGWRKVRNFYLELGKINILKKGQRKSFNTTDLIPVKDGKIISGHYDLDGVFP